MLWTHVTSDLNGEENVGTLCENKLHIKKSLKLKNLLREKMIDYMLNRKVMIILLLLRKMSCFPEPYTRRKKQKKVELDLSTYATKSNLKNQTGVDIWYRNLLKKADLTNLKLKTDKLDVDVSATTPVDLNKVRGVVKNCLKVVKKKKLWKRL